MLMQMMDSYYVPNTWFLGIWFFYIFSVPFQALCIGCLLLNMERATDWKIVDLNARNMYFSSVLMSRVTMGHIIKISLWINGTPYSQKDGPYTDMLERTREYIYSSSIIICIDYI